jgi:hypothetical protein
MKKFKDIVLMIIRGIYMLFSIISFIIKIIYLFFFIVYFFIRVVYKTFWYQIFNKKKYYLLLREMDKL